MMRGCVVLSPTCCPPEFYVALPAGPLPANVPVFAVRSLNAANHQPPLTPGKQKAAAGLCASALWYGVRPETRTRVWAPEKHRKQRKKRAVECKTTPPAAACSLGRFSLVRLAARRRARVPLVLAEAHGAWRGRRRHGVVVLLDGVHGRDERPVLGRQRGAQPVGEELVRQRHVRVPPRRRDGDRGSDLARHLGRRTQLRRGRR